MNKSQPSLSAPGIATTFDPATQADPISQWLALTGRALRGMNRHAEFILALAAPALLTICFYIPLRKIMNFYPGMDYAQYLMPIIVMQAVSFVATSAAMRSATDGTRGISTRLRSMPVHPAVPFAARLSANMVLLGASTFWAFVSGIAIGWRPHAGVMHLLGFLIVVLAVGLVLAFGADVIGALTNNPEATSQAMALPNLILGMLSTGFLPETRFPEWIRPFVRNQPISQITNLLRGFDNGEVNWNLVWPAGTWLIGLFALACAVAAYSAWRSNRP